MSTSIGRPPPRAVLDSGSTTDLLEHEFFEQLRPSRPQHVIGQGAFAGDEGGIEGRHEHLFPDALLLRAGDQLAVWTPDQAGAGVVGLILAILWPEIDGSRSAHLVGQDREARILAGP